MLGVGRERRGLMLVMTTKGVVTRGTWTRENLSRVYIEVLNSDL